MKMKSEEEGERGRTVKMAAGLGLPLSVTFLLSLEDLATGLVIIYVWIAPIFLCIRVDIKFTKPAYLLPTYRNCMSRPAVYNICSETRVARHNLADDYGKFLRVPEAEHFTLHSANNMKDILILVRRGSK